MYIYHYARYHVGDTYPYKTIEEAIDRAWSDMEFEGAWLKMITDEAGIVILDQNALLQKIDEYRAGQ